jgi:galactokinase
MESVRKEFRNRFGCDPEIVASAPGRVNLIGEHVDYMDGFVMPIAIDRETLFAIRANEMNVIRGFSLNFKDSVEAPLGEFDRHHRSEWFRYVLGVIHELKIMGHSLSGFDFCIAGNVPMGSGLSSSATVSVATSTALKAAFDIALSPKEQALLCQRAENNFVGVQCGIMDQFISVSGVKGHALRIDCEDLSTQLIPAQLPGCTWLVIDSKKKRGLVESEYNFRIVQCLTGLRFMQNTFPSKGINNLREVSLEELQSVEAFADSVVYKRVRHVITENLRVLKASEALKMGDLATLGDCLYESHKSLRDDFEVSCPELNAIVDIVAKVPGSVGARLTGAGFGGCAIALVRDTAVEAVINSIKTEYPEMFPNLPENAEVWPVQISDGARVIFHEKGITETTV